MDNELRFKSEDGIKAVAWLSQYVGTLDKDKEYCLTVKEYKKKRSLNANSLYWKIADKLAEHLNKPKSEIYKAHIKEIGGVSDTFCMLDKAVDKFCEHWASYGIGYQTDCTESKIKGCTNVIAYYGSSTYNTAQMSRLISLAMQDCEQYGIKTYSQEEVDRLVQEWGIE